MFALTVYKSLDEVRRTHPEIKNFKVAYQVPRGQTTETVITNLSKKAIAGNLYQVGDFVWQEAKTTPKICSCLEYIGDNHLCPRHGKEAE